MKFYSFISVFMILICNTNFAQGIIIEKNKSVGNSSASYHHKKNYELLSDDGETKVFYNNATLSSENQNAEKDINEDFTLTVNLQYGAGTYTPMYVTIFDEEEYYDNISMTSGGHSAVFTVPAGTYDIVSFSREESTDYQSYVIKEQISVNANTVINIDLTEADNFINIKFQNTNGDDIAPGEIDPVTGEISGGNANVYATTYLYFAPRSWTPFISYYLWENSAGNNGEFWNFFISDVSDRYSAFHTNLGIGYGGEGYASKYPTLQGVSNSAVLQNNPEEWVLHHEDFQPTILGEQQGEFYFGMSTWDAYEGMGLSGWVARLFIEEANAHDGLDIYLNNPMDGDPVDLLVYPVLEDYFGTVDPNYGDESFQINGNSLLLDENRDVVYGSGSTSSSFYFTGYDYNANEEGVVLLPLHPKFSFKSNENENVLMGNNVPISINSYNGMFFKISYLGRYGESRESDIFNLEMDVKQNGNSIFEGSYADFIFTDPIEEGQIEINLSNANTLVGGLTGSTTTKVTFDAGSEEDNIPPTLQMLQFRDNEGQVTDRFSSSAEGRVMLAAGDFEYVPEFRTYLYKEGNSVEFYYSMNGQNDWTQLELTQYDEHFYSPGFGDYYEASLSEIDNTQNDVWYDAKIICTDSEGNRQEQVIAPAFKINSTMGVDDSVKPGFLVYPNPFSDNLNIRIPENIKGNYTFKVTDLTGKLIYTQQKSEAVSFVWNGSSLPRGIYILTFENNGKIIAQKVIKK